MKQPAYRSNELQLFNEELVSSFLSGGHFFVTADQRWTSLKLFLKRVYTSGNIFLLLVTAQQTLLILCSVGVSVVLRLHSDVI